MDTQTRGEMTIEATITRADGRKENLGSIYSSNKQKNFFIQLRMKMIQKWQQFSRTLGKHK